MVSSLPNVCTTRRVTRAPSPSSAGAHLSRTPTRLPRSWVAGSATLSRRHSRDDARRVRCAVTKLPLAGAKVRLRTRLRKLSRRMSMDARRGSRTSLVFWVSFWSVWRAGQWPGKLACGRRRPWRVTTTMVKLLVDKCWAISARSATWGECSLISAVRT